MDAAREWWDEVGSKNVPDSIRFLSDPLEFSRQYADYRTRELARLLDQREREVVERCAGIAETMWGHTADEIGAAIRRATP